VAVGAEKSQPYNLPSFSLALDVEQPDTALITFQDRLNKVIKLHLLEFFEHTLQKPVYDNATVDAVELSGSYVWKELAQAISNGSNKYKVQTTFTSTLQLGALSTNSSDSLPSPSMMNLLLIEAFQGDSYWELVHEFLGDSVLEHITAVKITVHSDGYLLNNGHHLSIGQASILTNNDVLTPAMTAGVIFAGLLVFGLALMWTYLCCFARGALLLEVVKFGKKKIMEKADSVTDDVLSTSTLYPEEMETESRWMDAWAEAVTSIPLREPVKARKTKKHPSIRHPAQHHSTYLNCIEEAEDESSTVCSVGSSLSTFSKRSQPKSQLLRESVAKDEDDNRSESSGTILSTSSMEPQFEYKTSKTQLHRIYEVL